jgi:hypothetical protein
MLLSKNVTPFQLLHVIMLLLPQQAQSQAAQHRVSAAGVRGAVRAGSAATAAATSQQMAGTEAMAPDASQQVVAQLTSALAAKESEAARLQSELTAKSKQVTLHVHNT